MRGGESGRGAPSRGSGGGPCESAEAGSRSAVGGKGGTTAASGGGGGAAILPGCAAEGSTRPASPRSAARWRCSNRMMFVPSLIIAHRAGR